MTSSNRKLDLRVAARLAFADRRKRLIADWLLAGSCKNSDWALDIAGQLLLVNDAEINFLGGSY